MASRTRTRQVLPASRSHSMIVVFSISSVLPPHHVRDDARRLPSRRRPSAWSSVSWRWASRDSRMTSVRSAGRPEVFEAEIIGEVGLVEEVLLDEGGDLAVPDSPEVV